MQSPLWILWAAVILFALTNYAQRVELVRRLQRVERRLSDVARHTGYDADAALRREVRALVRGGRHQDAVRLYRQETGATRLTSERAVAEIAEGRVPEDD